MKHLPVAWSVAVVLAAVGIGLYARWPGVPTWVLNGLLVLPLGILSAFWLHAVLPLRVQWVAAWSVVVLGVGAYLLWPGDQTWQYGGLSAIPLIALAAATAENSAEPQYGVADGPWGPP